MKQVSGETKHHFLVTLRTGLTVLLFTSGLWLTSSNQITALQFLLSYVLLLIPWVSYLDWRRRKRNGLPVFAMISVMYWLYYALPLFWGDLMIREARTVFGRQASPAMLSLALTMSLVGVCCLWVGTKANFINRIVPGRWTQFDLDGRRRNYLRAVLVGSVILSIVEPSAYLLGEGGRQIIIISLSFVPLVAFTILFRRYLKGEASQLDKVLVFAFLLTRLVSGLSSGWLGAAASIMIICAASYLAERQRLPRIAMMAVIVFTLFFQVGKNEFRIVYWTDEIKASHLDRVSFWVDTSLEKWSNAIADPSGENLRPLLNQSLSRVSLLTQSANVLDQTPHVVPYQYGRLYSFLLVTFIPRFVWHDKPSVNEANQFYQIAYGVTAEEDIGKVSIGVGVLTEAFISFGWFGVVGIMFLLGVFFGFYQQSLLGKSSGLLMSSLGIALLPQMLGIESQMAAYLGGIVQQVLFSLLVLLPIIRLSKFRRTIIPPNAGRRELRTEVSPARVIEH